MMARARTGTVQEFRGASGGYFRARITLKDGSREWLRAPEGASKERARDWAAYMQEREDAEGKLFELRRDRARAKALPIEGEAAAAWIERYLKWREGKGYATTADVRSRLTTYALPHLAGKTMQTVTRAELEAIVRALDERVELAEEDESIRFTWKTAINAWGDVTRAFDEACNSKDRSLRVLAKNPCDGVRGPDRGDVRSKPFLYPSELVALLGCSLVPIYWRVMYAVAAYTGLRSNELAALTAGDVDLEHLKIRVTKQVDRKTGASRPTKTRRARDVDVEMELLPLLRLLVAQRPEGKLLRMPPEEDRAPLLRRHLERAGCHREALTADDELRAPIVFHGLRDTCLSHMAVRGDVSLAIQWRAGHTAFATTTKYIDAAKKLAAGFGLPFPALPQSFLTEASTDSSTHSDETAKRTAMLSTCVATPTGIEPGFSGSVRSEVVGISQDHSSNSTESGLAKTAETRTVDTSLDTSPRAELLRELDAASARGDLDAASRILARLMAPGLRDDEQAAAE